jgi:hypothetical protein
MAIIPTKGRILKGKKPKDDLGAPGQYGAAGRGELPVEDVALYKAAQDTGKPMSVAETTKGTKAYKSALSSLSAMGTLPSATGSGRVMTSKQKPMVKTRTPTSVNDENIRLNVIPELQAEVGKLNNKYSLEQLSKDINAGKVQNQGDVNARMGITAPSDTQAGGKDEYQQALDMYTSLSGREPEKSPEALAIDRDIAAIEQLQNSGRKDSLSARRAIAQQYSARRAQLDDLYANLAKTNQNALLLGGGARYAQLSSQGILADNEKKHIMALAQLDAEEIAAEQEVRTASETNNWKLVEKKLGLLKEKREGIAKKEEELRKATEDRNKELATQMERATRDSAIVGLMEQGVTDPVQILNTLNYSEDGKQIGDFTAEEVSETIKYLKENTTDPTMKETLDIYSKKLDIEKKLKDLEEKPGLAPSTLSKVQTIAQSYDKHPIVTNFVDMQNKYQGMKQVVDGGVGGVTDIMLVFDFMKALDPQSVVREAEYDTARQKSGNIFKGWAAQFNGYFRENGGFLPDDVRKRFMDVVEAKREVAQKQYKNYRDEQARKINNITKDSDGMDYLTEFDFDIAKPTYTTLEEYYQANEDEQAAIETLINENPDLSNEDILQILNSSDEPDEVAIAIPETSRLAYVNNNPGNLRFAGQAGAVPGEGGFAYFSSPYAGYKALEKQMRVDADRGLTLRQLIEKYAPPEENDTELYIQQIADQLGVSENTKIDTLHTGKLARAIMQKESGAQLIG